MNKYLKLALCITAPLIIGGISGISTAAGISDWYTNINKPSFNPPNFIFGPVWTMLYILMGISFYLILQSPFNIHKKKAIVFFCMQLILNFFWSIIFFNFHWLELAFIEIIMIWISILAMILVFYKINKAAAYLQIPYLLWVSFASILSGTIWILN